VARKPVSATFSSNRVVPKPLDALTCTRYSTAPSTAPHDNGTSGLPAFGSPSAGSCSRGGPAGPSCASTRSVSVRSSASVAEPEMPISYRPAATLASSDTDSTVWPGGVTGLTEKPAVAPAGSPEVESVTGLTKSCIAVTSMVTSSRPPGTQTTCCRLSAASRKPGSAVTFSTSAT